MSIDEFRPLTAVERRLLDGFLAHDFPGVRELRAQARGLQAKRGCTCGCGTIELMVQDPRLPVTDADNPIPVEGNVRSADGADAGGLLLFASGGRLASLEVYSYGDPLGLPDVKHVTWQT